MLHLRGLQFLNELLFCLFELRNHLFILFFFFQFLLNALFHSLLILHFLLFKAGLTRLLSGFLPMDDLLLFLLVFQLLLFKLHLHLSLFLLRKKGEKIEKNTISCSLKPETDCCVFSLAFWIAWCLP